MLGQFIFSTCKAADVDVRVVLQNGDRDGVAQSVGTPMELELWLFSEGREPIVKPRFGSIGHGDFLELDPKTLPEIYRDAAEWLGLVRCRIGPSDEYFPQEHQIVFHNRKGSGYSPLLYDQLPVSPAKNRPSPIILLAPKTWFGRHTNTFILFSSADGSLSTDFQAEPMRIMFFLPSGEKIHEEIRTLRRNGVSVLDVRAALAGKLVIAEDPVFLNVVAKGGASTFAIMTLIRDDRTGHIAFEHSLSPHYYVSGNLREIRKEALEFPAAGTVR